ncbi:two-component sensor histidine kinase [Paenibacillus taichungensis]|uniref:Signal transduction histidine-protein kinase ArlS n=1 Tax=Paenibacillus taichungensis TaxID=484184 RepID=A0A329QC05_9BACL|nr:HAMP domain-containing histidine kinase [Paenibacillus taichungensis]RAW09930.1 two-component sensor histidine kinase [Paenibacillus taichungensis]
MRHINLRFSQLPIRWKLATWSFFLLSTLFIVYNVGQYFVLSQWLIHQEEDAIRTKMQEIKSHLVEKNDTTLIQKSRGFIDDVIQMNQMVRILDEHGYPILSVSNHLSEDWVTPQTTVSDEVITMWHHDDHLLIMRSPLHLGSWMGTIEIVKNMENEDKLSDKMLIVLLAGGVGAVLLSAVGGAILSRTLLKPITAMNKTMDSIAQKGLHERVRVTGHHDELADLAFTFNRLMDQLEWSFEQQKQFVEDASHELRTPLTVIEGHISLLNRWGKHDPKILEESLQLSVQELQRLKALVKELLDLSRAESEPISKEDFSTEIHQLILYTINQFSVLHPMFVFEQNINQAKGLNVRIPPQHLEQILMILLDNAVKYSNDSTWIKVAVQRYEGAVGIEITDKGIGIPEEDLPHVFNRFYRVDKARSRAEGGSGLGLAIAERLVKRYDGRIQILSKEHEGTTVQIFFPC